MVPLNTKERVVEFQGDKVIPEGKTPLKSKTSVFVKELVMETVKSVISELLLITKLGATGVAVLVTMEFGVPVPVTEI
jgi:hypothetical protein